MMMTVIAALALAGATPTTDPCRDDRGSDRCLPAQQEKMRKLYRLEAISTHTNAQVRRIFL